MLNVKLCNLLVLISLKLVHPDTRIFNKFGKYYLTRLRFNVLISLSIFGNFIKYLFVLFTLS